MTRTLYFLNIWLDSKYFVHEYYKWVRCRLYICLSHKPVPFTSLLETFFLNKQGISEKTDRHEILFYRFSSHLIWIWFVWEKIMTANGKGEKILKEADNKIIFFRS